ncbi:chromosome condensation protein CrcB [Mycobacterium sp. ITM-2016-00317]|uniref:chromosome condensation protein CrcB n=1 Tax=Mycobacterium sp. ITM-2016-00317 TaxID=2099694 RepID=UPI000D4B2C7C|nr:chromosome condensation protein CrcB [Mycobacterium sp. ITM-2016-00317]WNG88975.1 chromosome condensation protein CrcB [Mycobacterium sp. ITM-2016-00317]
MPGRHRSSQPHLWAVVAGGAVGALIRYAAAQAWPEPPQMLISTTVTVALAFAIAGFLMTRAATSALPGFVLGVCAGAASLSAWAVLTVSQPPVLSIAFLTLTPAAAIGGLALGLLTARAVTR